MNDHQLNVQNLYPSDVYWVECPEFLDVAREVSHLYLKKAKKEENYNSMFPVYMTEYMNDPKVYPLIQYICNAGYTILDSQGFNMTNLITTCNEFWCQEHGKYSGHEEHVHGFVNQLTGMYFLDVPEDSCQLVVHDPRPAKRMINMYEKDMRELTYASLQTFFTPKEGSLYIMNSWLPHGFTRNANDEPFRFIHFNLSVSVNQSQEPKMEPIIV